MTKSESADVDSFVTALLQASRVLVGVSARSLAAVEGTVTVPQFRALVVLEGRAGCNLLTLADELAVNPSTAARMVDRLVAADLVNRQANPDNRREVLLALTTPGARVVQSVTRRRRKEITRIATAMPATRRAQLVAALEAFAAAAGEPAPVAGPLGW